MKCVMGKFFEKNQDYLFFVFRIIVGVLFMVHGLQKIFGILGAKGAATAFSLFWFAGIIEITVGMLLVIGLLTRIAAIIGVIEMIVAYITVHMKSAVFPWANGGELALLYLAAFLILVGFGSRKWSIDRLIHKDKSKDN